MQVDKPQSLTQQVQSHLTQTIANSQFLNLGPKSTLNSGPLHNSPSFNPLSDNQDKPPSQSNSSNPFRTPAPVSNKTLHLSLKNFIIDGFNKEMQSQKYPFNFQLFLNTFTSKVNRFQVLENSFVVVIFMIYELQYFETKMSSLPALLDMVEQEKPMYIQICTELQFILDCDNAYTKYVVENRLHEVHQDEFEAMTQGLSIIFDSEYGRIYEDFVLSKYIMEVRYKNMYSVVYTLLTDIVTFLSMTQASITGHRNKKIEILELNTDENWVKLVNSTYFDNTLIKRRMIFHLKSRTRSCLVLDICDLDDESDKVINTTTVKYINNHGDLVVVGQYLASTKHKKMTLLLFRSYIVNYFQGIYLGLYRWIERENIDIKLVNFNHNRYNADRTSRLELAQLKQNNKSKINNFMEHNSNFNNAYSLFTLDQFYTPFKDAQDPELDSDHPYYKEKGVYNLDTAGVNSFSRHNSFQKVHTNNSMMDTSFESFDTSMSNFESYVYNTNSNHQTPNPHIEHSKFKFNANNIANYSIDQQHMQLKQKDEGVEKDQSLTLDKDVKDVEGSLNQSKVNKANTCPTATNMSINKTINKTKKTHIVQYVCMASCNPQELVNYMNQKVELNVVQVNYCIANLAKFDTQVIRKYLQHTYQYNTRNMELWLDAINKYIEIVLNEGFYLMTFLSDFHLDAKLKCIFEENFELIIFSKLGNSILKKFIQMENYRLWMFELIFKFYNNPYVFAKLRQHYNANRVLKEALEFKFSDYLQNAGLDMGVYVQYLVDNFASLYTDIIMCDVMISLFTYTDAATLTPILQTIVADLEFYTRNVKGIDLIKIILPSSSAELQLSMMLSVHKAIFPIATGKYSIFLLYWLVEFDIRYYSLYTDYFVHNVELYDRLSLNDMNSLKHIITLIFYYTSLANDGLTDYFYVMLKNKYGTYVNTISKLLLKKYNLDLDLICLNKNIINSNYDNKRNLQKDDNSKRGVGESCDSNRMVNVNMQNKNTSNNNKGQIHPNENYTTSNKNSNYKTKKQDSDWNGRNVQNHNYYNNQNVYGNQKNLNQQNQNHEQQYDVNQYNNYSNQTNNNYDPHNYDYQYQNQSYSRGEGYNNGYTENNCLEWQNSNYDYCSSNYAMHPNNSNSNAYKQQSKGYGQSYKKYHKK